MNDVLATTVSQATLQLEEIYEEVFPAVASFVSKMGGGLEDARDIFHDALIIYLEKDHSLQINLSPEAYIVGIAKHLWIRKFKRDAKLVVLDDVERSIELPLEEPSPLADRILALIESSGKACLELLQSFYYEKLSPERIAERFNYSGIRSATVQKHKCLEKVRNTVRKNNLDYGDFIE